LKDRTIDNGSSSDSETTFDDDDQDFNDDRKGRKSTLSGFGIVPLDHEGTLGIGYGSGQKPNRYHLVS
jgi:hypothetical protein